MEGFRTGINLGGWLSQFKRKDREHFDGFITEGDIGRIADWGMDHVRLPIDYQILEDDERPYAYKETGFSYIDRCLEWCEANRLGVVIDLHSAPGYSFDAASGANSLFEDEKLKDRLIKLWEALIARYGGARHRNIIFELLNEIVLPSSGPWNALSHRIHRAIRAVDPEAWLMVGGNEWNSVGTLKDIEPFDDDRIVYSFHYYEPMPFTHQKAYWADEFRDYGRETAFPGHAEGLGEFLEERPLYKKRLGAYVGVSMDERFMEKGLAPAVEFMNKTGKPLYCGECGVIDRAPRASRLNWYRAFLRLMRKLDIGFACWSYKEMDFGMVDGRGLVLDQELVDLFARRG